MTHTSTDLFLLAPSPEVLSAMEIVELYALIVRTADQRHASESNKAYGVEVLEVSADGAKRNVAKPTHRVNRK